MNSYTCTLNGSTCVIRNVKTGGIFRQISRSGEKIRNVIMGSDTVSLMMENGSTHVYNINSGGLVRSFKG